MLQSWGFVVSIYIDMFDHEIFFIFRILNKTWFIHIIYETRLLIYLVYPWRVYENGTGDGKTGFFILLQRWKRILVYYITKYTF